MRIRDLPLVGPLARAGPEDPVFDWLLVAGVLVLVVLALGGRTPITAAAAGLYLSAFLGYVLYKGATRGRP